MIKGIKKFYDDNGPVFTMNRLDEFINAVIESGLPSVTKRKNHESYELLNVPCSFDIETTSYSEYDDKGNVTKKRAWMYIWMFGINGICIYGRTWDEYILLIETLSSILELSHYRRLVCYVHNLAFEFQFIRKLFNWDDIFCLTERKPIYALSDGIEYRCSYILTNTSLAKVGEDLLTHKCAKMVGDLDYDLLRGSETPISMQELGYCINDIRVVMCKIMECLETEKNIGYIPLTKTGYVRRDVKKRVKNNKNVSNYIKSLKLTKEEYEMAQRAFQGGFTHANLMHSNTTQYDVVSYDFTSSYPTVMIAEKFPMGNGKKVIPKTYEEFVDYLTYNCCLFDIKMTNVKLKENRGDAPLGKSKCFTKGKCVVDNGRIRECDELLTTITEQDYNTIRKFYSFDYEIGTMYVYEKAYLPLPIIESVLQFYNDKTKLKDVEGKEVEYQLAKGNLNSIYGMMVMNIIREMILYNNQYGWGKEMPNIEEALEEYNESQGRFNWYLWGIWITAYARKNLFTGIYECGNDYIYADTDSIKILNAKKHDDYIIEYNRQVTEKLEACLVYYGLDKSLVCPKTIENVEKPLGVWDFDGHYDKFKTLGAKKYMVESDGKIKTTIAGVSKKHSKEFLSQFEDPFEMFKDGLQIPKEFSGKLTHTYIDEETTTIFVDYLGNEEEISSPSGVHLEKASFEIGLTDEYIDLLYLINNGYEEGILG